MEDHLIFFPTFSCFSKKEKYKNQPRIRPLLVKNVKKLQSLRLLITEASKTFGSFL